MLAQDHHNFTSSKPRSRLVYLSSNMIMETQTFYILSLFSIFILCFFLKKKSNNNLPPTPPSYPIIGHLHLLKPPLHRTLQTLSYKYGPIFSLKFGSAPVIVVSTPQLLEECFSKNDIIFANRPKVLFGKYFGYNDTAIAFAQYGPHWRNMRKVLTLEFLSTSKLTAYFTVRKEERATLVKNLYTDSSLTSYKKVEMRSKLSELAFNNVMRMATGMRLFGDDVEDIEAAKNFRDIISKIFEITGCNMPNDFFRVLRWIDFQNYEKRMAALHKRSDEFLQSLVERIRTLRKTDGTKGLRGKTFIDEILDLQEAEPGYYTDDVIKGSIATVLFAGTDSTASTIEWAMSLLLNNPDKLAKARAEIDTNVGYDHLVDESEVSKLPYIQAIVSETLRLFPIAPMLAAHVSTEDAVVGGFNIPRGTMVLGNAWAVHRDPNVWEEPSSFKPERFTGAQVETYKFVPFGVGRRQCPGAGMANRMAGHSVAALIQCFDWQRVNEELVDLTEVPGGMTMPKKDRLEAMCKPRQEMFDVLSKL